MKRCNIDRLMTHIAVTHNHFFHALMAELDMSRNNVVIDCRHIFKFRQIAHNIERRGIILHGHDKVGFSNMGYADIVTAVKFACDNAVEYSLWRKKYLQF